MKYCPSCGKELRAGAKFCQACGQKLESNIGPIQYEDDHETLPQRQKSKIGVFLLLMGLLVFGYFGMQMFQKKTIEPPGIEMVLDETAGIYYDKAGLLTGRKNGKIIVNIKNGNLAGRGNEGNFTFNLTPTGKNSFSGKVSLNGVESECKAVYDPNTQKLTFSREGSPLDFHIEK